MAQLIRSLNLPSDTLSTALVTFARHFSLTLDPVLLAKFRREVLSLKTFRESVVLAAVAAATKGAVLTPEALARYVAAIDLDASRNQKGRQGQEEPGGDGFDRRGRPSKDSEDESGQVSLSGKLNTKALKEIRNSIDREDPLLSLLNSIPGKDGEYWMVYPLQVSAGGKRFRISVRVRTGIEREDARLAVDIAGEDRRWLFVVNRPQGDTET
ncbi:MAG: hypothetical protein LBE17_01215 [Treponema sp.]|nr:hypothetical protein [Treponema sp.]